MQSINTANHLRFIPFQNPILCLCFQQVNETSKHEMRHTTMHRNVFDYFHAPSMWLRPYRIGRIPHSAIQLTIWQRSPQPLQCVFGFEVCYYTVHTTYTPRMVCYFFRWVFNFSWLLTVLRESSFRSFVYVYYSFVSPVVRFASIVIRFTK